MVFSKHTSIVPESDTYDPAEILRVKNIAHRVPVERGQARNRLRSGTLPSGLSHPRHRAMCDKTARERETLLRRSLSLWTPRGTGPASDEVPAMYERNAAVLTGALRAAGKTPESLRRLERAAQWPTFNFFFNF